MVGALARVREVAERDKRVRFTTLMHHVYRVDQLRTAYHALKRDAAPGVDGETWEHYGEALEANLRTCPDGCSAERTKRSRSNGRTSPKPTVKSSCDFFQSQPTCVIKNFAPQAIFFSIL